ncbi:ThuA domain-containing protein [Arthrobacter caoxuetaonis]|uniref:ThuA domain-containing protein n=1 Tax=Arthrobacter caoxuetaonis TaxID=2886935 RepID=UPI001D158B12|nr:ThuA domain-containing protein [Arthrobacter caoxuetaonis]MCC3281989.1 ThuA domain-containing protein [Arthrobacter caoxuetaonis]MCC3282972.1 ThuA domain-containing protein [Arthrobacter caoxuetaonis]
MQSPETPVQFENKLRVLVWNECVHEASNQPASMAENYPAGIHGAVADFLAGFFPGSEVSTAVLADPGHGLDEERLAATDVLLWWGHKAHDEVSNEVVERVHRHVLGGMGLIVLHSGHFSKIFTKLMGTTCSLQWRNDGERELVWTVKPSHPIADGVPNPLHLERSEMYGELFDVPEPDDLVFISNFEGGEVFRSGLTFTRGHGRIFYFSPGDQDYPIYDHPGIQRVIANAVRWAAQPERERAQPEVGNPQRRRRASIHP